MGLEFEGGLRLSGGMSLIVSAFFSLLELTPMLSIQAGALIMFLLLLPIGEHPLPSTIGTAMPKAVEEEENDRLD